MFTIVVEVILNNIKQLAFGYTRSSRLVNILLLSSTAIYRSDISTHIVNAGNQPIAKFAAFYEYLFKVE